MHPEGFINREFPRLRHRRSLSRKVKNVVRIVLAWPQADTPCTAGKHIIGEDQASLYAVWGPDTAAFALRQSHHMHVADLSWTQPEMLRDRDLSPDPLYFWLYLAVHAESKVAEAQQLQLLNHRRVLCQPVCADNNMNVKIIYRLQLQSRQVQLSPLQKPETYGNCLQSG